MKRCLSIALFSVFAAFSLVSNAADPVRLQPEPIPEPASEERGIWGAIAYSPTDAKQGFFWGADKRKEAEDAALEHCNNADGSACKVVKVFRNHRHWDDDDGTGFPYEHCAALSVGENGSAGTPFWGVASAKTRAAAEQKATLLCGGEENECKIREWVCT